TGACPTATYTDFPNLKNADGGSSFSPEPASRPDALPGSGSSPMYIVATSTNSNSRLALRSVSATSGQFTLTAPTWVNVSAFTVPSTVPQQNGGAINIGDA